MTRQLSGVLTRSIRLYRQADLCGTHCSHKIRCARSYRGRCITLALAAWCFAWVTMVHPGSVLAQNPPPNVKYGNQALDLGMRSELTVNPITRAVELQIPLGNYPGRAGHDVSATLSYSSKVWNMAYQAFIPAPPPGHGTGQSYTMIVARYGEHSVAGWTSSIGFPVIDTVPTSQLYDQFGNPKSDGDCTDGCFNIDRIMVWMPDGSGHEFRSTDQP
jgi:hypothetical protein